MDRRKVAIITGASSGIGAGTAIEFARRGYQVSITGRNVAALEEVKHKCIVAASDQGDCFNIVITVGDIAIESTINELVETTIDTFGRIDTLVNAAGILLNGFGSTSVIEDYDRLFNVNVRSLICLTQLCIPHLIKTRGTVVNVSSIAGICSFASVTYYCMTKSAVDQYTKCLALELAGQGVRVNSVNPGVVRTAVHKTSGMTDEQYEQFLDHSKTTHPLGRVAEVNEVAKSIAFLAGPDSSFTTGNLLTIDGGRGIMTPR